MAVPDRTGVPDTTQLTEQYVLNRTYDPLFRVMAVELLGYDTTTNTLRRVNVDAGGNISAPAILTERYDFSDTAIIYSATAPRGTIDSVTGWTITKNDLSNSANSSGKIATDVSWNNRASGSYS